MKLEKQTIEHLKDLKLYYVNNLFDKLFFEQAIDIINQDILFKGQIKLEKDAKLKGAQTDFENIIISYSNNFDYYIRSLIIKLHLDKNEFLRMYNFYYFQTILHEVSHAYQGLVSQKKIIINPFVSEVESLMMYNFMYSKNIIIEKIKDLLYDHKSSINYAFERNANIYAIKNLYEIYESEDMRKFCLTLLFDYYLLGYIATKKKIISPLEITLKKLFCSMDLSPCQNMQFMERLDMGYPISKQEYQNLYHLVERPFETLKDCEITLRKIQRI